MEIPRPIESVRSATVASVVTASRPQVSGSQARSVAYVLGTLSQLDQGVDAGLCGHGEVDVAWNSHRE